jgi:hypothetical protein
VALAEDQHPVQQLPAQGLDDAFTDGIAIMNQEPQRAEAVLQVHSEVAGLLHRPCPVGCAVTPARCSLRVPCSMKTSTYNRLSHTVFTTRKSQAMIA